MKNANILVTIFLFSYLQTAFDAGELRHTNSNSNTAIKQSVEVVREFLGCDLSCMSVDNSSVYDQSRIVLEVLQLVCTHIGCAAPVPVSSPSNPTHHEPMPAILKEVIPQFEAPGMLNSLIIET